MPDERLKVARRDLPQRRVREERHEVPLSVNLVVLRGRLLASADLHEVAELFLHNLGERRRHTFAVVFPVGFLCFETRPNISQRAFCPRPREPI
jgi:hypothetical protein